MKLRCQASNRSQIKELDIDLEPRYKNSMCQVENTSGRGREEYRETEIDEDVCGVPKERILGQIQI